MKKILNRFLEEELKLVLANNNIRIEAPIAGKSMIGIEVSNKNIVPINMQEQFENISEKYKNKKLLISIGRNTTGDYMLHPLKKCPTY
ncbi:DNA translocase FtsK [Spiroplasma ixodetis]